jgi:hypothetical protein
MMVTAYGDDARRRQATEYGADKYGSCPARRSRRGAYAIMPRSATRIRRRHRCGKARPAVRHALAVDETGELLAFGSTSGGLWISENGGDSWTMPEARLPPIAAVRFAPAEH